MIKTFVSTLLLTGACLFAQSKPTTAPSKVAFDPDGIITVNQKRFFPIGIYLYELTPAVMADIRPDQRGVIAGVLNLSRNLGLITGASVMGAIFALASTTTDITSAPPEAVASGMRITFAVAAVLMVAAIAIANANQRRSSPCACDAGEPDGPFDHRDEDHDQRDLLRDGQTETAHSSGTPC